jgi:hypothetical protein
MRLLDATFAKFHIKFPVLTGLDRSFSLTGWILLCVEVQLRLPLFLDCTKVNVLGLPSLDNSHTYEYVLTMSYVSLHDDRFSNSILWRSTQSIFSTILKY